MSIIVNQDSRIIVQGITGNEGRFHTASMLKYGTSIVAGVTPGKGGEQVEGVTVYDTVAEAVTGHNADTSILFVPARFTHDAVLESIEGGIVNLVVIAEGVPQRDAIEFVARAEKKGDVNIVGPNCPGIICPGHRMKVGIMPDHIFNPGRVGIVSRSGTLTYEIAWHISHAGMGQSTCIGIGGDAIIGLDYIRVLDMFRDDQETESVVMIGEVGGNAEELAAQYIVDSRYKKPVVAYIAGRLVPPGKRMGHAGAIVMGDSGTAKSKTKAFEDAGVPVAAKPSDIVRFLSH